MSNTDKMAKLPGLSQRNGVWYLRVMIPLAVQAAYEGRTKLVESLRTSDHATAKVRGTVRRAELLAEFEKKARELKPQRVELVTPEMGRLLATRVSARVLQRDDMLRTDPAKASALLSLLQPFGAPRGLFIGRAEDHPPALQLMPPGWDPLDGLTPELLGELKETNQGLRMVAAQNMALQRVSAVLPMVKEEARALGLQFDEKVPGALNALRECLRAYRTAIEGLVARDEGEIVETPEAPDPREMKQARPVYLRDVLPQWKASKERREGTVKTAEKALSMYEEATGNPPIAKLTRAQGVECRNWLLAQGTTAKTARDRFDYIKGFLNFATRELELLQRNPWEGLAIEYATTSPRSPWSAEQIQSLFSLPLFTRYELPTSWDAGGDAAYWIPLLGLFTGARLGELVQLLPADVATVDGVPVIRITDEGGKTTKTTASRRLVPIHSELVRLGFLEYAETVVKSRAARLFPAVRLAPTKPSNYFSCWFATLRKLEDGTRLPDFHSFRHTVRSKLASAQVSEPTIDTLCGHEVKGSTGARTYTQRTVEDLRKAMEVLSYPTLSLPRVYPASK